ncbi:MAG TPA: deoxyguanosinetriphosphate triphosphohydrolase [Alphaproteobacteria bacterium]|nr:deoxyguanosinetriphosphate triphosphohydrolase [Alphaproteobacteria bacterium]
MALAKYATDASKTRGRLYPEREAPYRTCFQRDRDRIIHSEAFRRLESKTQVFVYHEGSSLRTRLTHSLEVSQITRSLCRMLNLDGDLGEALALAHDLGHTPFGHAGEMALNECMAAYGGFDHNAHSLKIVTKLEQRYPRFDGINLSWETLEGLVKHNGPLTEKEKLSVDIVEYNAKHDLMLDTFAGAEAQIASLADDIAYSNHDTDDGLKTGLVTVEQLMDVPLFKRHYEQVKKEYPAVEQSRVDAETVRRMINDMILDVATQSQRILNDLKPETVEDIRLMGRPVIAFSEKMRTEMQELKDFLFPNMYRHYTINRMTSKGKRIVRDLFGLLFSETNILPPVWQKKARSCPQTAEGETMKARIIADFVAGLTDASAIELHTRLFDPQVRL